jgi:hypothetical protein
LPLSLACELLWQSVPSFPSLMLLHWSWSQEVLPFQHREQHIGTIRPHHMRFDTKWFTNRRERIWFWVEFWQREKNTPISQCRAWDNTIPITSEEESYVARAREWGKTKWTE